jgi:hypothetical protein
MNWNDTKIENLNFDRATNQNCWSLSPNIVDLNSDMPSIGITDIFWLVRWSKQDFYITGLNFFIFLCCCITTLRPVSHTTTFDYKKNCQWSIETTIYNADLNVLTIEKLWWFFRFWCHSVVLPKKHPNKAVTVDIDANKVVIVVPVMNIFVPV